MTLAREDIIEDIMKKEGGYLNDPLGGKTMRGITFPVYQEWCQTQNKPALMANLLKLSVEEAFSIYNWLFSRYNIDKITDTHLQHLVFDACVNHGKIRAVKWLQELVKVTQDGYLGPVTAAAVNKAPNLFNRYLAVRIVFMGKITVADPQTKLQFLVGWLNRCVEFLT